ncbi:CocE/NonD family hydrolase [Mesorhizobium sp. VK22B]|uniref:CocE/NonD family hydrolase n=1 Tax=Mesorhizobium captivum TaxID=3072319 RepID=A0ABU4ZBU2_9HYPH|nr:CocE/NonD family hydrolase [Mesorhizobium sp. VK22B]MDX8496681.1 CocE/NonD family hydrolase [Mesorhizobium sp. VK22B]
MSSTKENECSITGSAAFEGVNAAPPVSTSASATTAAGAQTSSAQTRTGPRKVREIENIWIPMSDGTKIAARVWLPEDAEDKPVPVLMDYIPYRKREDTNGIYPYLASHGYACVRPDIRGSGDSEGLPQDEYVKQEQDDGVEIIAWLAKQSWCTGKVGMFGLSWGGYSALQVAARHPPELKAIITVCSTEDRYSEEPYNGGLIIEDMFGPAWGLRWNALPARSPDPAIIGDRWRDMWMERLQNVDFYVSNWARHQHRDAFWKHASVSEDYGAFDCPVYAVGGWFDPFHRTVPRMLSNLNCPRKGLVGPWGHSYPDVGKPGPAIDWSTEALRWWDYWLKDIDTGIMDEPMYRVWMQEEPAMRGVHQIRGRWVAEDTWPSPRITPSKFYLTKKGLEDKAGAETRLLLRPSQTVGITAPGWYVRRVEDAPIDQRIDDARSLTFDSEPIDHDFEILGAPVVTLDLAVDKPVALLAIRLNEVEPDGLSKRITYNALNLTHRDSHEFPEPLEPGKRYRIRLALQDCAHIFKSGNRIRVAVSTSYWPTYWPSPEPVTLTVYAGRSEIELPVRSPRPEDGELRPFGPPFIPEPTSGRTVLEEPPEPIRVSEWDAIKGKLTIRNSHGSGRSIIDATGTETWSIETEEKEIFDHDPIGAKINAKFITAFKRGEWNVRVETKLAVSLTNDEFLLVSQLRAFDNDAEIFVKSWDCAIPRMLV